MASINITVYKLLPRVYETNCQEMNYEERKKKNPWIIVNLYLMPHICFILPKNALRAIHDVKGMTNTTYKNEMLVT